MIQSRHEIGLKGLQTDKHLFCFTTCKRNSKLPDNISKAFGKKLYWGEWCEYF